MQRGPASSAGFPLCSSLQERGSSVPLQTHSHTPRRRFSGWAQLPPLILQQCLRRPDPFPAQKGRKQEGSLWVLSKWSLSHVRHTAVLVHEIPSMGNFTVHPLWVYFIPLQKNPFSMTVIKRRPPSPAATNISSPFPYLLVLYPRLAHKPFRTETTWRSS